MIHEFQADIDDVAAIAVVPSILQVMQATTGMGFVAVARVTEERWVACAVLDMIDFGLGPGGELTVKSTICDEIRQDHQLVAVDHFSENPIWIGHHTPLQYGLQSYISVPIILGDGSFFGTLCAVDPNPAQVDNPRVIGMAKLFADLIARHLDARRHLVETEQRLTTELETSHLRDQFIAILGHDIKNPVASIDAGARLLRKSVSDPQGKTILSLMEQSVKRVSNIVDNVMDFARGLGGGMALRPEFTPVGEMLEAIVAEFSQLYPERRIETGFAVPNDLYVDRGRLGQLFANLLSNAILHGDSNGGIRCGASEAGGVFELWVANGGVSIPGEMIAGIFLPFKRRGVQGEGLGLGLYIAAEIARAHGGTLCVVSDASETRFTLHMPAIVHANEKAAE
ncbi:HAMP domain-containing sensor histidine kinase [Rhizobium sp. 18055]|uniref:GAF domain-containing sensor histidine kinase n=1 Tax=Rhizobium sp. 18055 TaxID=2681403 RepID=UPI001FCE7BDC|nr:HAMP domain-containing sensor histidine kinase [Rhizobium sp. 18055]